MKTLDELALEHKTDKASVHHNYAVKYDRLLSGRRESVVKVLEIGVFGGGSLRMWRDYFPNATIFGLDNDPRCTMQAGERIEVLIGDQCNRADLMRLIERGPFDLIVDDGSHRYDAQIFTFEALWGALQPGGIYVVEDVATSYWRGWGYGMTTIDYFRRVVDCVNFNGALTPDLARRESLLVPMLTGKAEHPLDVASVSFHNGFIVVEKAFPVDSTSLGVPQ